MPDDDFAQEIDTSFMSYDKLRGKIYGYPDMPDNESTQKLSGGAHMSDDGLAEQILDGLRFKFCE